jgi:hypothetical protein
MFNFCTLNYNPDYKVSDKAVTDSSFSFTVTNSIIMDLPVKSKELDIKGVITFSIPAEFYITMRFNQDNSFKSTIKKSSLTCTKLVLNSEEVKLDKGTARKLEKMFISKYSSKIAKALREYNSTKADTKLMLKLPEILETFNKGLKKYLANIAKANEETNKDIAKLARKHSVSPKQVLYISDSLYVVFDTKDKNTPVALELLKSYDPYCNRIDDLSTEAKVKQHNEYILKELSKYSSGVLYANNTEVQF